MKVVAVSAKMTRLQWACAALAFCCINAIFVVPVKIYPAFFLVFVLCVCAVLLDNPSLPAMPTIQRKHWFRCCGYLVYVFLLFSVVGGDPAVVVKILLNVMIFLAASEYFALMVQRGRANAIREIVASACLTAVVLSFCQTFVSVAIGQLWTWPLAVANSSDAYAIQEVSKVYFGDENKNIWATKTLLAYCSFLALRGHQWKYKDCCAVLMCCFVLFYTASRTAQLAGVAGATGYLFSRHWRKLGLMGKGLWLALAGAVVTLFLIYLRVASLSIDFSEGNQGDGLLARFMLWSYFGNSIFHFKSCEVLFGHGVFAVSRFVSRQFEENNLHNVFLNQFFDFGIVGTILYLSFLVFFIRSLAGEWRWLFIPTLIVCISSQYFGYDPELMLLFSMGAIVGFERDGATGDERSKSRTTACLE